MRTRKFATVRRKLLSVERGGTVKKGTARRVALGFPNTYEVGISNLGFQTVYRLLNQIYQVSCERFFLFDFSDQRGTRTLESGDNIRDFDVVAFSVPFELDYPNVLKLLKASGIPLLSSARKAKMPLVIAGGIAPTLNPEVLAPFMDCLLIGEAEEMLTEFMERYLEFRRKKVQKDAHLWELSKVEGVYVPSLYHPAYHENGTVKDIQIEAGAPRVINRRSVNLDGMETFSPITSPYAHFKDSLLVEIGRGCARGCRFCAAGYVYQPCRFHKKNSILSQVTRHAGESRHVGLIGSLISDHPELEDICRVLSSSDLEIGTSSLRVDMISRALLDILVGSGMKTVTVAPEAGTDRMWRVIKKNIDRKAVLESARMARESDIPNLKLYFIIGLPFEADTDVEGIIDLVNEVYQIFVKGRKTCDGKRTLRRLKISVNPFIPKPHTPFQWCGMEGEDDLRNKLDRISNRIRGLKGVQMETKSLRQAVIQGVLSLGNRKVGEGLCSSVWEELSLRQAWQKAGLKLGLIAFAQKSPTSRLPWDIVDTGVSKEFLLNEFEKAERIAAQMDS